MTDRERLLKILNEPIFPHENVDPLEAVADYLLDSGVRLPVLCMECKYFLRHTKVDTDRGDCLCYGVHCCRVKHIHDYCSKGKKEDD